MQIHVKSQSLVLSANPAAAADTFRVRASVCLPASGSNLRRAASNDEWSIEIESGLRADMLDAPPPIGTQIVIAKAILARLDDPF
jgi:hypothetical protein